MPKPAPSPAPRPLTSPENLEIWGTVWKALWWGTGTWEMSDWGSAPLCWGKSQFLDFWSQSEREGNLFKTHMCSFYKEPPSRSENKREDSLAGFQYWNGGPHVSSASSRLGTWHRSQRWVIFTSWRPDGKRQLGGGGCASVLPSPWLFDRVCYIPHLSVPEPHTAFLGKWVSWYECKGNSNPLSSFSPNLSTPAYPSMQHVSDCLSFLRDMENLQNVTFQSIQILGKKDARIMTSLLADKLEWEELGRRCLSRGRGKGPRTVSNFLTSPFWQPSCRIPSLG